MKTILFLGIFFSLFVPATPLLRTATAKSNSAKELEGLWEAKRRFGPDVRGNLHIKKTGSGWKAEIAGKSVVVNVTDDAVSFQLPDGKESFQGKFDLRRTKIVGHWIQPATVSNGTPYASPVSLSKDKTNVWRGDVAPLDDELRLYLMITPRNDGSTGAFLKNPERNLGRFIRIDRVEKNGGSIKLFAADTTAQRGAF